MTSERDEQDAPVDLRRKLELLWGDRVRPSRGPKPELSRDRIVAAAIEVADADGLPALSMRRVAERLGFTTMSLYRHVPSKAELVDLMADAIVGEPPPLDQGGWRPNLAAWARGNLEIVRRHPWGLPLAAADGAPPLGPNSLAWLESALRALSGTGLDEGEQIAVVILISSWVRGEAQILIGQAAAERDTGIDPTQWGPIYARLLRSVIDEASHPALSAVVAAGVFDLPQQAPEEDFSFGLELLLNGVEQLIAARAAATGG